MSSSSVPPPLLSAAGAASASRSATAVIAKAARGFQVFRIDGYSLTTSLPGGERISSDPFMVGGRCWQVDYFPNGADGSTDDSDAIALYLRLHGFRRKERVRAEYKFSLLDPAGNAAYELPAERGIFAASGGGGSIYGRSDDDVVPAENNPAARGYAAFITKEDLRRRRESLLRENCLAIRCDIAVVEVETVAVGRLGLGPRQRDTRPRRPSHISDDSSPESSDEDGGSSHGGRPGQPPPDDKEYIRRCLAPGIRRSSHASKRRRY